MHTNKSYLEQFFLPDEIKEIKKRVMWTAKIIPKFLDFHSKNMHNVYAKIATIYIMVLTCGWLLTLLHDLEAICTK